MCANVQTNRIELPTIRVMPRKSLIKPYSTNFLDYPASMSAYEIESLAAEATLAKEKATAKACQAQNRQRAKNVLVVI